MANEFNDGQWILDTASVTAVLLGKMDILRVRRIEWHPGANAESMIIKDRNGKIRATKVSIAASPAGDEIIDYTAHPLEVEGFVLHTLGGGTVYVDID